MKGTEKRNSSPSLDHSYDGSTSSSFGPADNARGWGSEGDRGYDPASSVILCLEYLPDSITRGLILLQRLALLSATGLLIWELLVKLHMVGLGLECCARQLGKGA
jgi:hypothetical protein